MSDDESETGADAPPITDAILLCGGRGTRLGGDTEKPLVTVGGRPMLRRVLDALAGSRVETVHAVSSPATPATSAYLDGHGSGEEPSESLPQGTTLRHHEGTGEGYVADLDRVVATVGTPALSVVADLPLVTADVIDRTLAAAGGRPNSGDAASGGAASLAVCVPAALKRDLGVSCDTTFDHEGRTVAPTGVNVVADGPDTVLLTDDERLAVNVNRPADLAVARERAEDGCD